MKIDDNRGNKMITSVINLVIDDNILELTSNCIF